MGRRSNHNISRSQNAAKGSNVLREQNDADRRQLRNDVARRDAEIESIKRENLEIKNEVDNSHILIDQIREEIREKGEKLITAEKTSEFWRDQVKNLQRNISHLKNEKDHLRTEIQEAVTRKSGDITDALLAQKHGIDVQNKNKMTEMKKKVQEAVESSPSYGNRKKFADLRSPDSRKQRCRTILDFLKREVGVDGFDDFVQTLIHLISNDPSYTFKLKLSEMDSFIATVKWKFSDGTLRDFKAFLKEKLGFDIFSSRQKIHQLRKVHSCQTDYKITVQSVIKKAGGKEVEAESALIEVNDLHSLLARRYERLHQNGRLKFRDGCGDVRLGVGGDKGASQTKLVVILGNVENPNNPHGILLIGMYEGNDDYASLQANMSSVFQQINTLSHLTYKENDQDVTRSVIKFPIGDCKFLSAMIGHPGQSSKSPCFICDLPWTSHGAAAATVGSFDFKKCGNPYDPSSLKPALMQVEEGTMGVPGVHTILGLTNSYILDWLYALCNKLQTGIDTLPENIKEQRKMLRSLKKDEDSYQERCDYLRDCQKEVEKALDVFEHVEKTGAVDQGHSQRCQSGLCLVAAAKTPVFRESDTFSCISCQRTIHCVCSFVFTSIDDYQYDEQSIECQKNASPSFSARRDILLILRDTLLEQIRQDETMLVAVAAERKTLDCSVDSLEGEVRKKLEELLKSIGCDLRTWYQQLTGNQTRSLLREENIQKLLDIFPPDASINIQPMKIVMLSLSKLMSSANNKVKSDEEIEELERVLDDFVTNLKLAQPNATVTPKLHILTAHLIPFLKKHRTWGSITEQGVEHLHAIINGLNRRLASVLNTRFKASLVVKALSNYNFSFDVGLSWFKVD